jgi:Flp pilus assembly protein TadG
MKSIHAFREDGSRRGAIAVLSAVFLIVILAFASFSIDFGYIVLVDQEMQSSVDAAALAAAQELQLAPDGGQNQVVDAAVDLAALNQVNGQELTLQPDTDVDIGIWDELTGQFTPFSGDDLTLANAVRVRGELSSDRDNAMNLFFAPVLGQKTHNVASEAIAVIGRTRMRDVMLVIDCSGSMSSYNRMTMTRAAALVLCDELGTDDRLGLAVYSYPVLVNNGNDNDNNSGRGNAGLLSSVTPTQFGAPFLVASLPQISDGISAQFGGGYGGGGNNGGGNNGGGNNGGGYGGGGNNGGGNNGGGNNGGGNNGGGNNGGGNNGGGNNGGGNNGGGNNGGGNNGGGNNGGGNNGGGNNGGGNNGGGNNGGGNNGGGNNGGGNNGGGNNGGGNNGGGNNGGETRLSGRLEKPLNSNVQPVVARIPQLIPNLYASTTCIGGGMRVAIQEFLANPRYDQLGDKVEQVMVLMTDGQANETEPPGTDPIDSIYYYAELARQNDIIIHGITLGQNAQSTAIEDAAETTSGQYHHVSDGDFEGLFEIYRGIGRGGNQPRLVH